MALERDAMSAGDASPALAPETVLADRYEIQSWIGRGGMGSVYAAHDRLVGDRVALKVLDIGPRPTAAALEMFRREVRLARRVTHPNVVRIHDLVESAGRLFITMEHVDGSDLRKLMNEHGGRLPAARAARIGAAVAEALAAAHAVGVVHRDIKPENVLLERSGRILLSDFGIAGAQDPGLSGDFGAHGVAGTPAYMAPEQVAGETLGPAADLFALGVVIFELVTGRLPFEGDTAVALAIARLEALAPDPRSIADVPEPLAGIVRACLRRDPATRPRSAGEVARAFEAWLVAEPAAPASPALAITQVTSSTPAPTLSPTVALLHGGSARAIACLPFGYRGPSEHDYLGEVIAGELTDVLSRTRGLRVLSSSAVRSFEPTRDPREICHALGIDFVVSGSVQLSGEAMRIAVRLADATGTQISSERFDIDWGDVFEVQERAGAKIAEVLRVELTTAALRERVPREAVELYLRARRLLRAELFMEAATALDYLHRALQICPDFGPALAAYARAAVQMWFNPQRKPTHDWERIADAAVTTALRTAPDLAETHVAAARLSSHRGQLVAAIQSLRRAIEIAPTAPEAHTQLGQLECEAGRFDSGLSRLALAYDLEPTLGTYFYERARVLSFQGDHHAFHACLAEGRRLQGGLAPAHLALRHAMWWRDERLLRSAAIEAGGLPAPLPFAFEMVVRAVTAELAPGQLAAHLSALFGHVSPRFSLILRQILVEVHAYRADLGGALTWLRALDDTFFYDFAWLLYCPLLDELRIVPEVAEIMRTIKQRCDLAWAE